MNSFKIKTVIIIFLTIITAGSALPQHHDDTRDDHKNVSSDRTKELLDKIKQNLKELDADYLTQLRPKEYKKALKELYKMYKMIDAIKMHIDEEYHPVSAISESDYRNLVTSINNESFEENKVTILRASAKYNYFTVDQVIGLMDLSTFSSWKLRALEITYPLVLDKNNSFKIINSLNFSDDKQKAQEILDKN